MCAKIINIDKYKEKRNPVENKTLHQEQTRYWVTCDGNLFKSEGFIIINSDGIWTLYLDLEVKYTSPYEMQFDEFLDILKTESGI